MVRHEALRTRFVDQDGLPRQVIDPAPADLPPTTVDVPADAVDSWVAEQIRQPVDLATGPVFRTALARLAPDEHVLVLVVHHIVADGWSVAILAGELSRLYAAETGLTAEARLPGPAVQPADHAAWQRRRLAGEELQRQLGHWRTTLADLPTLDVPTDRPRPAHPSGAGARTGRPLPDDLSAAAHRYARDNRVSFLAVLHAALLTVLHRYTGQTDLPIGSVFSGRTRTDIEPLVGYFANTVVLRTHLDGNPTFADLIRRCHDTVLDASAHQDIPFSLIVDTLQPDRVPGRNPLFQTSLTLQPARNEAQLTLGTVAAEAIDVTAGNARFDLAIDIEQTSDGRLAISAEYSTELFDPDRIHRLLDHYTAALTHGLARPDRPADIDILPPAERDLVLRTWNPAPTPRAAGLLHRVTAGHDPDRVAIRFRGVELTYGRLEQHANRLANALLDAGVGPGHVVGLLLDRGLHLPVAQIAVMKAGAAWLPLDPQLPPARLGFMAADAAARLVLTTTDLDELATASAPDTPRWRLDDPRDAARIDQQPDAPPNVDVRPEDPAYLLYTSGSTGQPKGVLVHHRGAYSYCQTAVDHFGITPDDRIAQVSNPAFDASIFDCYATLLAGATLISAPRETIADPAAFTDLIRSERVTLSFVPPAVLALLDPEDFAGTALRGLWSAGEALPPEQATRWPRPGLALHNSYGPTETTVVVTDYRLHRRAVDRADPDRHRPAQPSRLCARRTFPPGTDRRRPDSCTSPAPASPTATTTGPASPPNGSCPTRTPIRPGSACTPPATWSAGGPTASWSSSAGGTGRSNSAANASNSARSNTPSPNTPTSARAPSPLRDNAPVGYIVGDADLDDVRRHLADRLPTYMIPTTLVPLPELPLTPNGKLDTARLPDPSPRTVEYRQPRTDTERWLADTWQDLLGIDQVSATDNFFDLGGNSLHVTQLVARVRDHDGTDLHPRQVFTNPVLDQLARHIERTDPLTLDEPIPPVPRIGPLPCTRQQEGMWFQHQLDPASTVYQIPLALRLRGALDVAAFGRAVHGLVTRHEALRTRFVNLGGLPQQEIDPPPPAAPLPMVDDRGGRRRCLADPRGPPPVGPGGRPPLPLPAGPHRAERARAPAAGAPHRGRRLVGPHPRRRAVPALRHRDRCCRRKRCRPLPASRRTTRLGNAAGSTTGFWTASSPSGGERWPICPQWTSLPTGRARPGAPVPA